MFLNPANESRCVNSTTVRGRWWQSTISWFTSLRADVPQVGAVGVERDRVAVSREAHHRRVAVVHEPLDQFRLAERRPLLRVPRHARRGATNSTSAADAADQRAACAIAVFHRVRATNSPSARHRNGYAGRMYVGSLLPEQLKKNTHHPPASSQNPPAGDGLRRFVARREAAATGTPTSSTVPGSSPPSRIGT